MRGMQIARFAAALVPLALAANASCGGDPSPGAEGPEAAASSGSTTGSSSGTSSGGSTGSPGNGTSSGGGSGTSSGGSTDGGSEGGGADAGADQASGGDATLDSAGGGDDGGSTGPAGTSVLEHHNSPTRNGVYVDATLTKATVPGIHRDMGFNPTLSGDIYAQPLFIDGGASGTDMILVATEQNWVYALDTTGKTLWSTHLAPPVTGGLPCGDINPLGVTGTPIVDSSSRTMYLDAMTTPDGNATAKRMVYALSIDTGKVAPGWPLDVSATFPSFPSNVQSQRGALALGAGMVWIPYGGMSGDCHDAKGTYYRGSVVAIPLTNPAGAKLWTTKTIKAGAWAGGGIASDGTNMYLATGNGGGGTTWAGSEAVIRFKASDGAVFSGQTADYFAAPSWSSYDGMDKDIGSSNPVVVSLPGNSPSTLVFQIGKPTTAWLLDPADLGGVGNGLASAANVTSGETLTAPVAYTTKTATYVAFKGPCAGGGAITALKVTPGSPPKMAQAWCSQQGGSGSLAVSTTDGQTNFLVWGLGGGRLYAFDADTGAVVFGGGGGTDGFNGVPLYQTPMVAKGYVYVGTKGGQLVRFH